MESDDHPEVTGAPHEGRVGDLPIAPGIGPDLPDGTSSSPASTEPIVSPTGREVAPGGWRRALTGVAVGLVAGLVHRAARMVDEGGRSPADGDRGGGG